MPVKCSIGWLLRAAASNRQETPSAAFDGTNYLVAWYDDRNGSERDIYGARVTQAGSVLDPGSGIPISTAPGDQFTPAVAFGGDEFLVTWEDRRSGGIASNIYAARVSQGGGVLDPGGIAVSTAVWEQYEPSVGFDGTNYLLAWTDFRSDDDRDIYGARVIRRRGRARSARDPDLDDRLRRGQSDRRDGWRQLARGVAEVPLLPGR